MTTAPQYWLKTVTKIASELFEIPLWGSLPPFPWEKCAESLQAILSAEKVALSMQPAQWREGETLLEGLGIDPLVLSLAAPGLEGVALWVLPRESIPLLISKTPAMVDPSYAEGFYRYFSLELLAKLAHERAWGNLCFHLVNTQSLPQSGLCSDVTIEIDSKPMGGRLICSPDFLQAFKGHFATQHRSLNHLEMAKELTVALGLEIGSTTVVWDEWELVKPGDFVILERCAFDPKTHKGSATLSLNGTPLFRTRIKQNSLKILDYAFYAEEAMDKLSGPENNKEEPSSAEAEEDAGSEHLWSSPVGGEHAVEKLVATHQLPITFSVEVAKIHMNMERLLQLQPGNVLELPIKPEQGVYLMVNGKPVAKGELLKLGDSLGVRILEIG